MSLQQLTLVSASPPLQVTGWRGQQAPVVAGGVGGWQEVARPRRKALTQWTGVSPLRETFGLLLDGFRDDRSVEADCLALERMAQPPSPGGEPPLVRVLGVVPHADLDWVVESYDWDSAPIYSTTGSGYRVRQEVVVHLLEYVADDRLVDVPAAEQRRRQAITASAAAARAAGAGTNQPPHPTVYIVKTGDTLLTIAAALLGSYKRWQEIADLNGIRDPKAITVGETLRLP